MKYEDVINYFKDNTDLFNRVIEELDCYSGFLDDDRWYPMDELSEFLCDRSPVEAIEMATYGNFSLNDSYFRINGYGNLDSDWDVDYSDHLDEYFVRELVENYKNLDIDDKALLSMLKDLEKGEYE